MLTTDRFRPEFLTKPLRGSFTPEDQIPKFLEIMRWPRGVRCIRCRSSDVVHLPRRQGRLEGRYLYHCRACRSQFTVTTGTVLDRTHIPLEKWLRAIALIRKDSSRTLRVHDLVRRLGVTRKTARLMRDRLRRGMRYPFVRNLYVALRTYKTPEAIFGNLFPDLPEENP